MGDMADWVNDDSPEDDSREERVMSDGKWSTVGAFWHSTNGGKAKIYGELTIDGRKLRVSLFENPDKEGRQPDFRLAAAPGAEWEEDEYAVKRAEEAKDEKIPF